MTDKPSGTNNLALWGRLAPYENPWEPTPTEFGSGLSNFLTPQSALSSLIAPSPPPRYASFGAAFQDGLGLVPGPHSALASLVTPAPPPPRYWSVASTLLDGVPITTPPHLWYYVIRRFNRLLSNVDISPAQREDGTTKWQGINSTLNRRYWGHNSETLNGILIGSWGKRTQTAPPRDVDLLFLLPADVYHRFQQRTGNQQSQLLQEIKEALAVTYPQTKMRADGQVVVVPFNTIEVEVAPGFRCDDGSIIVCDANNNGRYITSTSEAEISDIESWDTALHGNTGALIKMGKRWQHECNVPLKSFHIERLAIEFLTSWPYRLQGVFYYDWMVRDFFAHIIGRANGVLSMPGTGETVWLGDEWLSRAQSAFRNATSAAENERDNYEVLAGEDWQKIFGTAAPRTVS